jgi:hypothetical protein
MVGIINGDPEVSQEGDMMMASCRATADERCRTLPGDSLIPEPMAVWTRGVTITSSCEEVWPWIAQLGADRAGWYSYDFLDNGGRPSATRILPEHQKVVVGQVFPALPGATDAFIVTEVNPVHTLVLTVPGPSAIPIVSWGFLLEDRKNSITRLLVRARMSAGWRDLASEAKEGDRILLINRIYWLLARLPGSLMILAAGFGHGIMERRMLRGIKKRAEA